MKLALVSPTPVPPAFGGMDRLLDGLVGALRERHPTDLVTIPFDERTREGVLRGYKEFYDLDLSAYDRIITYKAPAYMVRHPNQVLYLSHRLRVFYDLYQRADAAHERMRDIIHFMDNWALDKGRLPHIFTVGETVSRRLVKFGGIASTPIHHPTTFSPVAPRPGEYLLSVGRLHAWKRVDLIIRAFRRTKIDCPLIVAGEGPEEETLRRLAKDDGRIQFAGKVSDARLAELYSRSLAVIFPPISEDMGLITFEAFLSGKPVVTTRDSGEPSLIIEEGKTGWVAEPTESGLAEKLEAAWGARAELDAWGARCLEWMKPVTWERLVDALLKAGDEIERTPVHPRPTSARVAAPSGPVRVPARTPGKIRLLVTDNQIIDPPIGGGRVRILELYRHMPEDFETVYIGAFDYPGPVARDQTPAPNFREILTPLTSPHFRMHNLLARLTGGEATIDVTMPVLGRWTPRHRRLIEMFLPACDVLIGAHPWMFPFFPKTNLPVVYDSQNCETYVKEPMLRGTLAGRWLARRVRATEAAAIRASDRVLACSEDDARAFAEVYGTARDKVVLAPNGVDCARILPVDAAGCAAAKRRLDLTRPLTAVFTGSNYLPNLEGVELIIHEIAAHHPEVDFVIAGGSGPMYRERYSDKSLPPNIRLTGFLEQSQLFDLYHAADLALNPMRQGSGTNIKMLDYLAAGLPILTSPKGARGIEGRDGEHWIEAAPDDFGAAFGAMIKSKARWGDFSAKARRLAESRYNWKQISAGVAESLRALVEARAGRRVR